MYSNIIDLLYPIKYKNAKKKMKEKHVIYVLTNKD